MNIIRNPLVVGALLSSLSAGAAEVKVGGDFRLRHEKIDKEGSESRSRQRLRARLFAKSQVTEQLQVEFRIATGSEATSRNQSFDGGFGAKEFNLDLAYFNYLRDGVQLTGGKIKNPFFRPGKSPLVWDSDVTLEGVNLKYSCEMGAMKYFAQAGEFWYDERSGDRKDGILYSGQVGGSYSTDSFAVKFGAAVYNYNYIKGQDLIDGKSGNNSVSKVVDTEGNVTSTYYTNKYIIQDFGLEITLPQWGVTGFVHSINNGEVDEDGAGYLAGASIKAGALKVTVATASLEKDATVGALSDGDFGGGGTDRKGERILVSYKLDDNSGIGLSQRFEKLAVEDGQDFKSTIIDLKFKF